MKLTTQIEGKPLIQEIRVGVEVKNVLAKGIGFTHGIQAGDVLQFVNGEPIRDLIDYKFHIGEEEIKIQLQRGDELLFFEIRKNFDQDLGLVLEEIPILKCDNKCVFCFLHQMPKGMRKTLYYQDDDYRYSFLHGSYVTLTNLSESDFKRIVDQRLSPIYISVHSTDPTVRGQLLGRRETSDVLSRIDYLGKSGIQMHAQVVLCPELNDGPILKKTIFDLISRYPFVESVGVVPLGLTRYRKNLPKLNPITPKFALDCIDQVAEWQVNFKSRFDINFVYLSDEFYLLANKKIPEKEHYDGFPLVENGVGMVRRFIDQFEKNLPSLRIYGDPIRITLVTGILSARFIREMSNRLNNIALLEVRTVVVPNKFFGKGITVSGLLTGRDILDALKVEEFKPEDKVLLPSNCLNHDGVFLDDIAPVDLSDALGCEILVGNYNLIDTIKDLFVGNNIRGQVSMNKTALHPYINPHQITK